MIGSAFSVLLLIISAILVWKDDATPFKGFYWPALLYKLSAGIALGYLYSSYFIAGETFSFFQDGSTLASLARHSPGDYLAFLWSGNEDSPVWSILIHHQSRSLFMTKTISLVNLLTNDNYWITSLYFSFFSFLCAWHLAKVLVRYWPGSLKAAVISFLIYPSVVFWTSGVTKEAAAIPCLFFLTAVFLTVWNHDRLSWLHWIGALIVTWMAWRLKYYYLGVFLSVALTALLVKRARIVLTLTNPWASVLVWFIVFVTLTSAVTLIHPNFDPGELPSVIVENYYAYLAHSDNDRMILYPDLEPTAADLLRNAPKAFFSGLFRPFPWEAKSGMAGLAAIENTVFFISCLGYATAFRRVRAGRDLLLVMAAVTLVALLGTLLPLSTPNFGTLSRYRISYLPFLAFLVLNENPLMNRVINLKERLFTLIARKQ